MQTNCYPRISDHLNQDMLLYLTSGSPNNLNLISLILSLSVWMELFREVFFGDNTDECLKIYTFV